MALHFKLLVNGGQIGSFEAVRRESKIPKDRVCHYDVTIVHNGQTRWLSNLPHNFDEGALTLIWLALSEVLETYEVPW